MDSTDWKLSFFPGMIPDSPVLWPVLQHKGAQIQQTKGSAKPQAQFVLPTNQPNQSAVQPRTTPQMVSGLRIRNQVAVNGQKTITVQFNHPSGDPYFAGANVYLRRAGQEPTLVAGGSSSPLSFTVPINDAPHTVHVTSFGNWGETDVLKSPSAPVKLAGIQAGKVPTVPADISVTATSPSSPSPSTPFFFDGVWNSATAYSLNYIVLFNSSTYICLLANTNQQPDESPTYWTLLSENLVFYPTIATTVVSTGVQALDVSNQVQGNSTTVTATATPSQANDIGFWFAYLNVSPNTMSTPSGWINIFASGPNILGFMDQFSSSSPLSLSNGISSQPWASNLLLFKTAAGYSITASVTQVAVSAGNVATVLCANSFSAGTQVGFSNLVQATFLNGNQYTILTATSTQFTFSISGHASYGPTADTGTATNLPYLQVGTQSSGGLGSTATTVLSSPVTAGSTIIALIAGTGGAAPSLTSASDTLGNTWYLLSSNSGSAQMNVAYAQNVIGGATDTITLNSSNGYVAAIIASWELSSSVTTIYHYVPYDVVQFRGGWFVCLEETTQDAFTNPSAWGILSFSVGTVDALVSTPVTLNILNRGQLISNSTATADTVNLPATPPDTAWYVFFQNSGAGSIIISPNGLNLDGSASSLTLIQNQGVMVFTDGTNYFTERGFGTVFSVGLTMPSIFSVASSPITSSGTIAVTLATETANTIFAGPTTGSAATPTFRAMVVADLPTSGTWPFAGTISGNFTTSGSVTVSGELIDSVASAGTSGQFLSSTGTAVKWVTPRYSVNATAQTSSISTTTITTPIASQLYTVEIYEEITSGAGFIQTTIGWTDDNGSQTLTPIASSLSGVGFAQGTAVIRALASDDITYATTLTGTATFNIFIRVSPLG